MNWIDYESHIAICPPKEFNFEECLVFLGRSSEEILHQIRDNHLLKVVKLNGEFILMKIESFQGRIHVEFPLGSPTLIVREEIAAYIWEWFDLESDLREFYEVARQDKVLKQLSYDYYGLRIMGIPDLFEALAWAVIGQQINLTFAYILKKRLVEKFGECITYEGLSIWVFPSIDTIATLELDDLKQLQFSARKAEYIIGIAQLMIKGELSKQGLLKITNYQVVHKSLVSIRGIGPWTADYVMMKCLHYPTAFPITDVGLHNALKYQLGLERKPTIEEIKEIAVLWKGWQAYATFYLWRSLYA